MQALSAGLGSRFGRYRHLPPSPRAKRGQRAGVRRGWFLRYAQSETKQKSRPKKEPPQRKGWKKKGSKVEVPLRKKQTGKASPTPSRRRGCAAHAGESWRFLGGTRFSLCGRVELLRQKIPPARFWRACGDPPALALLKVWQIPAPAPKPPREARPIPRRSWVVFLRGVWLFGCLPARPARRPKGGGAVPRLTDLIGSVNTA